MSGAMRIPDPTHVDLLCEAFGATWDLRPRLVALGYVGSISHGTHGDVIDDVDLMGIVAPPARHVLGMGSWEHWDYGPDPNGIDCILYSVRKMYKLMLQQNPNVLGFLWLRPEHYLVRSIWFDKMLQQRSMFLSAKAYNSFAGYARSQLKRLQKGAYKGYMGKKRKALVEEFGYDPKNAAHLLRLLRMATEFLDTGHLNVDRTGIDATELRAIKGGSRSLDSIQAEAENLFQVAKSAYERTDLPAEPDYRTAEKLLMRTLMYYIRQDTYVPGAV